MSVVVALTSYILFALDINLIFMAQSVRFYLAVTLMLLKGTSKEGKLDVPCQEIH